MVATKVANQTSDGERQNQCEKGKRKDRGGGHENRFRPVPERTHGIVKCSAHCRLCRNRDRRVTRENRHAYRCEAGEIGQFLLSGEQRFEVSLTAGELAFD